MYQSRTELSANDIYNKEFKIDARGYNPKEVDRYLDIIIRDYKTMASAIDNLEEERDALKDDNLRMKQEIRNLKLKLDTLKDISGGETSNADVLRRLSNLEKIIYGKE